MLGDGGPRNTWKVRRDLGRRHLVGPHEADDFAALRFAEGLQQRVHSI